MAIFGTGAVLGVSDEVNFDFIAKLLVTDLVGLVKETEERELGIS